MISKQLVEELQTIIKEDYKKEISFSDAVLLADNLAGCYDSLAKIYHRMNMNEDMLAKESNKDIIKTQI